MFSYVAYGLNVHSSLVLPELIEQNRPADITIRTGEVQPNRSDGHASASADGAITGTIRFFGEKIGTFLLRNGEEFVVDPVLGASEEALRLFILGTGLAVLLHQRGFTVLHASSVAVRGKAVVFLGEGGAGKSTLAAAMHARGHALLTDDVTAIESMPESDLVVRPGFPQFKLWPRSLSAIGKTPEGLPRLNERIDKRAVRISSGFSTEAAPLNCIYLLEQDSSLGIEPMSRKEALAQLLPHWYSARISANLMQALGLSSQFLQCAQLAEKVGVFRLRRPLDLEIMPEVLSMVEEHQHRMGC